MCPTNDEQSGNRDLIHRFTEECWNHGDLTKVMELVAADCRHDDPVFPHIAAGAEGLQRHISRIRRAFPDLKFTITDENYGADNAEVQWSASATQVAEFLGISPRDQRAAITGKSIYRIEAGKIVENRMSWDVISLMQQLGSAAAGQHVEPWSRAS